MLDGVPTTRTTACINGRWRSFEIRACTACGREAKVRTDSRSTLCRSCSGRRNGQGPKRKRGSTRSCAGCGASFYAFPSEVTRAYCSPTCARIAQRADDHDLRVAARTAANNAQRDGLLLPQPCEICGAPEAQKHHEDYEQPLLVNWLCARCHTALHVDRGDLKAMANRRTSMVAAQAA